MHQSKHFVQCFDNKALILQQYITKMNVG